MEKIITIEEFINCQNNGRIYICRPCFDNKKQIVMLKYEPGLKSETVAGVCSNCTKVMSNCIPCKSNKLPFARKEVN